MRAATYKGLLAGTETGSLTNHLFSRTRQDGAIVGMGVTILLWTDRIAGTIVQVTPTQIHVREDRVTRTDANGMSENQQYNYEADPNGILHIFRKTKRGYRSNGCALIIGSRDHYHDYSF